MDYSVNRCTIDHQRLLQRTVLVAHVISAAQAKERRRVRLRATWTVPSITSEQQRSQEVGRADRSRFKGGVKFSMQQVKVNAVFSARQCFFD